MSTVKSVRLIENLKTFDPNLGINEETTVYVQGYYRPGDGGGGTFVFVKYSEMNVPTNLQPTEDGGVFIESTVNQNNTNTTGIWVRIFSGFVDVRYYGAMGMSQDNTLQIQKAIDYAYESVNNVNIRKYGYTNSNTVYLPNESYFVSKLIIKSSVKLIGSSLENTVIASVYDDNKYLIELDNKLVRDIHIKNITFVGNSEDVTINKATNQLEKIKGCFGFIANSENESSGIWDSIFKNILIIRFTGNSIYFRGSVEENDFSMPMQFNTFENVQVESVGQLNKKFPEWKNNSNSLVLEGLVDQFSFTNCRFDGGSFPENPNKPGYNYTTTNVYIGARPLPATHHPVLLPHPGVISFNTCTFQLGSVGVFIESCNNIKFDTCWFERFERAITCYGRFHTSKSINVLNSLFGFCAGNYGGFPDGTGRVIIAQNTQININNNYVIDVLQNEETRFIAADTEIIENLEVPSRNLGINSSCNFFEPQVNDETNNKYLGYTNGLKKDLNVTGLTTEKIDIYNSKVVYLRNDRSTYVKIKSIKSYSVAGEYLFLRSDQGEILLNEQGNIYLGNRATLLMKNGDSALFIKIDEEITVNNIKYFETYNLVTFMPRI